MTIIAKRTIKTVLFNSTWKPIERERYIAKHLRGNSYALMTGDDVQLQNDESLLLSRKAQIAIGSGKVLVLHHNYAKDTMKLYYLLQLHGVTTLF